MKNKTKWVILLVLLFLAVGGYAIYQNQYESKYGRMNWAKDAVAAKLIDGESARFRNVREVDSIMVCGEVNAKNRYGAYTGFIGFDVVGRPDIGGGASVEMEEDESPGHHTLVKSRCGG